MWLDGNTVRWLRRYRLRRSFGFFGVRNGCDRQSKYEGGEGMHESLLAWAVPTEGRSVLS